MTGRSGVDAILGLIEDYALIGDTHSAGLVSRRGSIDWLCLPRFDSSACFAAILDEDMGGHWSIHPRGDVKKTTRRYRDGSMVLETTFETSEGAVSITDCLPLEEGSNPKDPRAVLPEDLIVRLIDGVRGTVPMEMEYAPRFDYGYVKPWLRRSDTGGIEAIGGPDALELRADVDLDLDLDDLTVRSTFRISEGDSASFVVPYYESRRRPRTDVGPEDAHALIKCTDDFWRDWIGGCSYDGRFRDVVTRSLLILKALTYSPTGGLVAAPTTSLPEALGGVRNWDYRHCWLRDATFTLEVLMDHGFRDEAEEWRDWLLRAVAGDPAELQIMYGVRGERRLPELELWWLSGYENSRPVRTGNAAVNQFQLDVYGEVMDALHSARRTGIDTSPHDWEIERHIVEFVCDNWREADEGIWEVRGDREHFTHSKVMAWVAVDRGVRAIERFGRSGPLDRWRTVREEIREEILNKGFDSDRGCFTRVYGQPHLDASLLVLPLVGFIDATDERMMRTIELIEEELVIDGFVMRYAAPDGLPPGEGAFLMCSLWLADCLMLVGRTDDAERYMERVMSVANDVGLLSEEYSPHEKRLLGNFPQAFSHTAAIATATILETAGRTRLANRSRSD